MTLGLLLGFVICLALRPVCTWIDDWLDSW